MSATRKIVVLRVGVDAEGTVRKVVVIESAGPPYDERAVNHMFAARFKPATDKDGRPIPAALTWRYGFELDQ